MNDDEAEAGSVCESNALVSNESSRQEQTRYTTKNSFCDCPETYECLMWKAWQFRVLVGTRHDMEALGTDMPTGSCIRQKTQHDVEHECIELLINIRHLFLRDVSSAMVLNLKIRPSKAVCGIARRQRACVLSRQEAEHDLQSRKLSRVSSDSQKVLLDLSTNQQTKSWSMVGIIRPLSLLYCRCVPALVRSTCGATGNLTTLCRPFQSPECL
jgi:hypothetical protein